MTDRNTRSALWPRVQELMLSRWGKENQNRLAREAKVGVATIARMKSGDTSIGLDVIEKVAEALEVEAWQLICPPGALSAQAAELSPMALDLACALEKITDPELRRRAYAVATQVIAFGTAPSAPSASPLSPAATPALHQGQ